MAEGYETRRRIAQFRGIPLEIFGSTRSGGRRLDVHQFGKREKPWAEDLGRTARTFSVRGFVGGADHDLDAERLEKAFEKVGPGELILPHRAPISVAVESFQFEEPERETRIQRFSVEFVEAGVPAIPGAQPYTAGVVEESSAGVLAATRSRFADVFTISDQTAAAVDRTVALVDDGIALVEDAFDALKSAAGVVEEIAAAAKQIDDLANRVGGAIVDAAVAAAEIQDAFDTLLDLPFEAIDVFRQLSDVANFGLDLADPGSDSIARGSFKRNQDAFTVFIRQTATTTRARALAQVSLESSSDAVELRNEMEAELARIIVDASDAFADEAVAALRTLRTATIRDLDVRGARLPARVVFSTPALMPSILVAQRLYNDPERESEIVDRNRDLITNPGRILFGQPLEVLSDG